MALHSGNKPFGEMETSGLLQRKKELILLVAKHSLSLSFTKFHVAIKGFFYCGVKVFLCNMCEIFFCNVCVKSSHGALLVPRYCKKSLTVIFLEPDPNSFCLCIFLIWKQYQSFVELRYSIFKKQTKTCVGRSIVQQPGRSLTKNHPVL